MRESREAAVAGADLLNLKLPCPTPTAILKAFVQCIYGADGTVELSPDVLLPTLQLADAIQVRALLHSRLVFGVSYPHVPVSLCDR